MTSTDRGFHHSAPLHFRFGNNKKAIRLVLVVLLIFSICFFCGAYGFAVDRAQKEARSLIVQTLSKIKAEEDKGVDVSMLKSTLASEILYIDDPKNTLLFWNLDSLPGRLRNTENELIQVVALSRDSTAEKLRLALATLQNKLDSTIDFNLPVATVAADFISIASPAASLETTTLPFLNEYLISYNNLDIQLEKELKQSKRDVFFEKLSTQAIEGDTLALFFKERQGYEQELQVLNSFKNRISELSSETYVQATAEELETIAQNELEPTLAVARAAKDTQLAKEKREELDRVYAGLKDKGYPRPAQEVGKLIVIDVNSQRLYAYEDGLPIFNEPVPITTGKYGFDTVRGSFAIYTKARNFRMRSPFPGIYYDSVVQYWMPFYSGYGIHDAYWRDVYGTQDYHVVGSHGCVNTPLAYVKTLYEWANVGTPVIVY